MSYLRTAPINMEDPDLVLTACLYCASDQLHYVLEAETTTSPELVRIGCQNCKALGPLMPTREAAVAAWNSPHPDVVTPRDAWQPLPDGIHTAEKKMWVHVSGKRLAFMFSRPNAGFEIAALPDHWRFCQRLLPAEQLSVAEGIFEARPEKKGVDRYA